MHCGARLACPAASPLSALHGLMPRFPTLPQALPFWAAVYRTKQTEFLAMVRALCLLCLLCCCVDGVKRGPRRQGRARPCTAAVLRGSRRPTD